MLCLRQFKENVRIRQIHKVSLETDAFKFSSQRKLHSFE